MDTTKAGSGKLSVEVTKENGSSIEASIREVGKKHKVRFDPTGPGVYTVRVFYATVEVPGEKDGGGKVNCWWWKRPEMY